MTRATDRRIVVGIIAFVAAVAGVALWANRPPRNDDEARRRLARLRPAARDTNVIVVTLDTTRADRLGCYGGPAGATPHLDALAAEGVVFEQAAATVPLTLPSHASMFTGLLPPHHGVRDNGGFFLDEERVTLAEELNRGGWTTGAFVAAWVLDSKWGLAQGFDHYSDRFDLSRYKTLSLGSVQKPGEVVVSDALRWLETVKERRFFAWVHLYDAHSPYEPPEPYRSRFPGQPYLAEIAYDDAQVGRLVDWLREHGLMDRTTVVVVGDHGESLGEHEEATHGYFIYESTLHVPFVVRTPWGRHGRVAAAVSGADVFATVLDLAGVPPPAGIDGRSRARWILDPSQPTAGAVYAETYFPRYHFGWQHMRALREGRYKYIDAPQPELYDLEQDPREARNIFKANSKRADDLRLAMERLAGRATQASPERKQLDPETLQRLAALGYVGNTVDVDPTAVLPDPKSKIKLFVQMNAAKAAAHEDRLDEAITRMRSVIAEDPAIVDAYLTIGVWLSRARRPEEAIAAYREVLSMHPENELALVNLAHIYRSRGDTRAAIEGYRSALKIDPRSPQTWFHLATLFLDLGRVDEAENTFRQAAEANPRMGAAWNSLGGIAYARGDGDEAERLIRKGLELEPEVRTGRFNLARILEEKGRLDAAQELYLAELDTYPDSGKARFNLAQLLRQRGDGEGYLAELRASVEQAPDFGPSYLYLAREQLNAGRLDEASDLARRGLAAQPASPVAPLGHYVLADVYNRRGEPAKAQSEVAKAQRIEAAMKRQPPPRI